MEYSYTDRGTLYRRGEGSQQETFTYDALGNLTRVDRTSQPDIDYEIDAQGRRIGKRVLGSLTRQYVWAGGLRIAAELQGGTVASRFIYGNSLTTPDLVVRRGVATDRIYRVISDHLGSPVYIVNIADAADVWLDASYDEWGNVTSFKLDGVDQGTSRGGWPIPQGFAGGLYDPDTGLVRFGARDYDPRVGRWTAKDPILFDGGQGNLYVYVGNDPVGFVDSDGLNAMAAGAVAGAAVNTIGYLVMTDTWTGRGIAGAIIGGAISGAGSAHSAGGALGGGALGYLAENWIAGNDMSVGGAALAAGLNLAGAGAGKFVAGRALAEADRWVPHVAGEAGRYMHALYMRKAAMQAALGELSVNLFSRRLDGGCPVPN